MSRKKVLIQSDFSLLKTGFAKNAKIILTHLYKTGKYDIVHYCCGLSEKHPDLPRTPWKSVGCLPASSEKIAQIEKDPTINKIAAYGAYYLDDVIEAEKPDVYIAIQDIWGVDFAVNRKWFNKITSAIWTTLDSLPILPTAIETAKKVKNYWVWSNFATKELNKMGYENVQTTHGALESKDFFRLSDSQRKALRKSNNINEEDFIIGFVFRNQLRKSVPNLLQGFKKFKETNPESNAKLLLHTHMEEGWPILSLAKEQNIAKEDILVTHVCSNCKKFVVKPYEGQNKKCDLCGSENSLNSTSVSMGVDEAQLNEVYNLMDVYCHPFTSGGQEIPIQEAKLTELITLVTDYSCGAEMCEPEACSLPLEWSEYREFGSNFIKASTNPDSIADQLAKVYSMPEADKSKMGKEARKWVIDNFSIDVIGKKLEDFIDSSPKIEEKDYPTLEKCDPDAIVPSVTSPKVESDSAWIKLLYKLILKTEVDDDDEGLKYWLAEIKKEVPHSAIEKYFRQVALKDNAKKEDNKFKDILDKDDEGKRILFVIPNDPIDVFSCTALFKSITDSYENYNLYVATQPEFKSILEGNEYVHKIITYEEYHNNSQQIEEKKYFNVVYTPKLNNVNFHHFNKDVTNYDVSK